MVNAIGLFALFVMSTGNINFEIFKRSNAKGMELQLIAFRSKSVKNIFFYLRNDLEIILNDRLSTK